MIDERADFISGLRTLAQFYEDRPDFPLPYTQPWSVFPSSKGQVTDLIKQLGSAEKSSDSFSIDLTKKFSSLLSLRVCIQHELVCTKRVVGKKIIPARVEHEVEIVEWDCPPSLLAVSQAEDQK